MRAASVCAVALWLLHAGAAVVLADPFDVPFASEPARYDARTDAVVASAAARPDPSLGRGARAAARQAAEAQALRVLHRFVDDALASARVHPRHAAAAHAAVDRGRRVTGRRPLVDGGAVVRVEVEGALLRDASAGAGLPWAP